MKKIVLSVFVFFMSTGFSFASDLNYEESIVANKMANEIYAIINDNQENKDLYLEYLSQKQAQYEPDSRNYAVLEEVKAIVEGFEITKKEEILPISLFPDSGDLAGNYNIDMNQVAQFWLEKINQARTEAGLSPYSYENGLNASSNTWAKISKQRGYIDHKRASGDGYYNYWKIASWMKSQGVTCQNINRKTFSESIAYGYFSCSDGECSDELSQAIMSSYNFFMSEKGKAYSPHYDALMSSYFTQMGLGMSIVQTGNTSYKYYLVNHYCTKNIN